MEEGGVGNAMLISLCEVRVSNTRSLVVFNHT